MHRTPPDCGGLRHLPRGCNVTMYYVQSSPLTENAPQTVYASTARSSDDDGNDDNDALPLTEKAPQTVYASTARVWVMMMTTVNAIPSPDPKRRRPERCTPTHAKGFGE